MAFQLEILADIERKTIERLKTSAKLPMVKAFEVKKENDLLPTTPAIRNVIADGKFTPVGQRSYRVDVTLYVIIIFRQVSDEESRRKGIYPIIGGVVQLLAGQELGLKIDELTPLSFREITNATDAESGLIVFQVPFATHFSIEKVSDEQAADLVQIGINYYLDPAKFDADRATPPDAEDKVTITQ